MTFDDWESTGEVIRRLRSSKVLPYLFEFLDRDCIQALNEKLQMSFEEVEATLLVDVEEEEVEIATGIFRDCGARKITLAKDEDEAEALYEARSMAYLAVKSLASGVQIEDVALPIDRLGEYLKFVKEVASSHGIRIPVNGHAGDGNVHPTILYDKSDDKSKEAANLAYEELCRKAIAMGGSVTAEHGVGIQKTKFLREQLPRSRGSRGTQTDERNQEDIRPQRHHEPWEVRRGRLGHDLAHPAPGTSSAPSLPVVRPTHLNHADLRLGGSSSSCARLLSGSPPSS